MARGTQLLALVDRLKDETGRSSAVSVGVDELPSLKNLLRRTQNWLYEDYDWPFLRVNRSTNLQAGERYYDFPTDLNVERVEETVCLYNTTRYPVLRGIEFDDYNTYDSDLDERSDPILKWDVRSINNVEQAEVWPIPASNATKLLWRGIRALRPLIADADVCDLDDDLIVLFAASEILQRQKSSDAKAKLDFAQQHYTRLKGRHKGTSPTITLGGGTQKKFVGTIIRVS